MTSVHSSTFSGSLAALFDYGIANGAEVVIDSGTYPEQLDYEVTGPLTIKGEGNPVITGKWRLTGTYATSADPLQMSPASPFLCISGLTFNSGSSADYALTIEATELYKFVDTLDLSECKFFGRFGFRAVTLTSVSMSQNRFYNTAVGMRCESCTNWAVHSSFWRNASRQGVCITQSGSDQRLGGENIKFSQCEWAVCSTGLYLDRHAWARLDSCLADFCVMPVYAVGSRNLKMVNSYLGASVNGSVTGNPDYSAPPAVGIAFYTKPVKIGANIYPSSFTAALCEFINYDAGGTQPVLLADGYIASDPQVRGIDRAALIECTMELSRAHTSNSVAAFSYVQSVSLSHNQFISYNVSTSLGAPYTMGNVGGYKADGSDCQLVQQAGAQIPVLYETVTQEYSFLPGISFGSNSVGVGYSSVRIGRAQRYGSAVDYAVRLKLTAKGSSTGPALITNLPIPVASLVTAGLVGPVTGLVGLSGPVTAYVSGTTVVLSSGGVQLTHANFTDNAEVYVSGTYFV